MSTEKSLPPQKEEVVLTEEEEVIVRELLGGVSGEDDWDIIVVRLKGFESEMLIDMNKAMDLANLLSLLFLVAFGDHGGQI